MRSHNKILLKIEKHYDNEKTLQDADGKDVKILTDVEDGNKLLVGDRNLEEYQKLCIGEVAMNIGSFSKTEKLPYRSMDGLVHKWSSYDESDIKDRLKVGTKVLFQHNVTMNSPIWFQGEELWLATATRYNVLSMMVN